MSFGSGSITWNQSYYLHKLNVVIDIRHPVIGISTLRLSPNSAELSQSFYFLFDCVCIILHNLLLRLQINFNVKQMPFKTYLNCYLLYNITIRIESYTIHTHVKNYISTMCYNIFFCNFFYTLLALCLFALRNWRLSSD